MAGIHFRLIVLYCAVISSLHNFKNRHIVIFNKKVLLHDCKRRTAWALQLATCPIGGGGDIPDPVPGRGTPWFYLGGRERGTPDLVGGGGVGEAEENPLTLSRGGGGVRVKVSKGSV